MVSLAAATRGTVAAWPLAGLLLPGLLRAALEGLLPLLLLLLPGACAAAMAGSVATCSCAAASSSVPVPCTGTPPRGCWTQQA
jgi:hypothetical protein